MVKLNQYQGVLFMGVEVGPSGSYVYVSNDGLNGQSLLGLQKSRDELVASDTGQVEMLAALDEVMEGLSLHGDVVKRFKEQGRFLIGIDDQPGYGNVDEPLDGLFYAEAEGLQDNGSFSVVRMGTWIRQGRVRPRYNDDAMREQVVSMAFTDVEHNTSSIVWGVPITRRTRITPLHPTEGELAEGYVYGHKKDSEAINGLDVPNDLKRLLGSLTDLWHNTNVPDIDSKNEQYQRHLQVRNLLNP